MSPQVLLSQQDPDSSSFAAMANLRVKSLGSIDYVEIDRPNASGEAKQLIIFVSWDTWLLFRIQKLSE